MRDIGWRAWRLISPAPHELIDRAQHQFDALKTKVDAFFDEKAMSLRIDEADDLYIVRAVIPKQPPEDWWMDVGELAGNARSALDHLVYQLAIDSESDPSTSRTQFPIFEVEEDYLRSGQRSLREKMLRGVATRHRTVIDNYQPYQRGRRAADDPLAILRVLTDRHKHRLRHTSVGFLEEFKVVSVYPYGSRWQMAILGGVPTEPLCDGDEVFAATGTQPQGEVAPQAQLPPGVEPQRMTRLELEPEPKFTLIFLGDRPIKIDDIDRTIPYVKKIISRFERRIAGKRPRTRTTR